MRRLMFSVTRSDLEVQTFRCGGAGGQHRDKTSNGVRITHPPSGAVGKCTEHRSQAKNKEVALKRLADSFAFRGWVSRMLD